MHDIRLLDIRYSNIRYLLYNIGMLLLMSRGEARLFPLGGCFTPIPPGVSPLLMSTSILKYYIVLIAIPRFDS